MSNHHPGSVGRPNCNKRIGAKEPRDPHRDRTRPDSTRAMNARLSLDNPETVIRWILYINIGLFTLSLLLTPREIKLTSNPLTTIAPANSSLMLLGATGVVPIERLGHWWSLLSASYLHGGLLHILMNMFALRQLGALICHEFGTSRMFIIYTLSGIGGFGLSYLAGVNLTIGASAALYGLIGAAIYFGKSSGGVYGRAIYKQLVGWTAALFILGFLVPRINNWGHGGGILCGLLLGFLLGYRKKRRETRLHGIAAGACVALTGLVLAWAVSYSIFYRITE